MKSVSQPISSPDSTPGNDGGSTTPSADAGVSGVQFTSSTNQRDGGSNLPRNDTVQSRDDMSTVTTVVDGQSGAGEKGGLGGLMSLGKDDANSPFLVQFGYNDPQDPRNFATWRKWQIALFCMTLELWANVISSIYAFGVPFVAEEFGVSTTAARVAAAVYLFGFALGPVFLAPASEDLGRYPILGITFFVLGLTQIACALAPNLAVLIIFRFIGGFCGAATFNTIGTVSDMWNADDQGWAVNCFALFAEVGATVGPVFGGYLVMDLHWRWIFGVAGIVCGFLLIPFLLFVPETRAGVLLARRAKKLRKETGDDRYFAMHERIRSQHTASALAREMVIRPIYMLFTEPIVTWFAIFDGVNYAVIYIFLEAYPLIFTEYGFNEGQQGLAFIGITIGFGIGFCLYAVQERWYDRAGKRRSSGEPSPEDRLLWGMPGGLLFPISLFFFAWTSFPPVPWIVPILAGGLFGISSHILFLVASDYVGEYSINRFLLSLARSPLCLSPDTGSIYSSCILYDLRRLSSRSPVAAA